MDHLTANGTDGMRPWSGAPWPSRPPRWASRIIILGVPACLFAVTLYPGVGGQINPGDSAKFQFLGKMLGVAHDPGYPQYLVLNHLWTTLPTPLDLATHVNALSAVFTLLAGGLIWAALRRLTRNDVIAAVATWTALFSSAVWTISTEAEVYTLHLAYVGGVLWAGVRWRESPTRGRLLTLIAIALFSLGNHPLAIALPLSALVVAVGTAPTVLASPRVVASTIGLAVLSVAQYGYLWWRSRVPGVLLDGLPRAASLRDVIDTMLGGRFAQRHVLSGGTTEVWQRGLELSGDLIAQLTLPAAILAVLGLIGLFRRDRVLWGFLAVLGGVPTVLVLVYHIRDWGGYVAPIWVVTVTFAAMGVCMLSHRRARAAAMAVWGIALVGATGLTFQTMAARTNPFDRDRLLQLAGRDGVVLSYLERSEGRSYRERQLSNYYRVGVDAGRRFNLDVVPARRALEERVLYLGDRPIYFLPGAVRRYVDTFRLDYVPREDPEDPSYHYFVTAAGGDRDSVRIDPAPDGYVGISVGDATMVTPVDGVHIVVMAEGDRRVKGVRSFPEDALRQEGWHSVSDLLTRVPSRDWVVLNVQGQSLAQARDRIQALLEVLGAGVELSSMPERALVLVGQRSVPTGWRVLCDPGRPVDLKLAPTSVKTGSKAIGIEGAQPMESR